MLLVFVICGVLVLLMAMDGAYLMSINRRLRETAALAERASDAKTQFLSSMSHDIRTPMNAVLGMTDIARRNVSDPECVTDCLNKVTIAGNHLLTLINDILDISKVESGRMRLNPSSFSLERSIASIEDIDTACEKGLGYPMGPFKLMDMTGLDVNYYVRRDRFAESGDPNDMPSFCVVDKVIKGEYGRKTGKGWYEYPAKK